MATDPSTTSTALGSPPKAPPKLVAVVDIGATSIRMAIAEIAEGGQIRTLEKTAQAVTLGRDTFSKGVIEPATTEECVRVLKSYRQLLAEYNIRQPEQIHVVATSAVREAANRASFLQRVYVATGFLVEPFDEAAVNRITYLGVQPLLEREPMLANAEALIVEVGGGSTEVLAVYSGNVAYAQTYRLGSLRLRKTLEAYHAPSAKERDIMESQIQRVVEHLLEHLPDVGVLTLIALGGDVRYAAAELVPGWDQESLAYLPLDQLQQLTDELLAMSVDELVHERHLAYFDAETIGPALLAYYHLAKALGLDNVLVSSINLRDGLIKAMATEEVWTDKFTHQIIRSAIDFGRRFGFNEDHARHVAELSKTLFRALQPEHQLDSRDEVILYVAALLHDIGYAVSARSHHKHSMYLITHGELFGLSRDDVLLAALTARYHRRSSPKPLHEGFAGLDWEQRIRVSKLAALLRVADALDRSNSQRIKGLQCLRQRGRLIVSVSGADDLSLEQLALRQKASLFKEIFGMPVLLRNAD
jgi:exopolyphosphatase / guanosine-5'-triphosphate,3'-diphosphate pyrophosphatase